MVALGVISAWTGGVFSKRFQAAMPQFWLRPPVRLAVPVTDGQHTGPAISSHGEKGGCAPPPRAVIAKGHRQGFHADRLAARIAAT